MPIEPQLWGQLVLGLLGIASTIATGLMAVRLVNARRAAATEAVELLRKKELELEQEKRRTAEAEAARLRSEAESHAIRQRSDADLLKVRSEARQGNEMMEMVRQAFIKVADIHSDNNAAQTLTAAAINKNSETVALLTALMTSNHKEVITNLDGLSLALRGLPEIVDGKLTPLYTQVTQISTGMTGLIPLLQTFQMWLLSQSKFPLSSADNGTHTDEVKQS